MAEAGWAASCKGDNETSDKKIKITKEFFMWILKICPFHDSFMTGKIMD